MRKSELGSRWPVSLAYVVTSRPVRDLVSKNKVDSVVGRQYLKLSSGLHVHTDMNTDTRVYTQYVWNQPLKV